MNQNFSSSGQWLSLHRCWRISCNWVCRQSWKSICCCYKLNEYFRTRHCRFFAGSNELCWEQWVCSVQCVQLLTLNKQSSLTHWINLCKWQTMTKQKISLCLTYGRTQVDDFSFGQEWLQFKCSIQDDIIIAILDLREDLLCPRRKMQRLARRRAIATVGSGWQQLWHRVWMEDGWQGGGGQGEEAGGAASPGGHLWRPLHTWWDLLVSVRKSHLACSLLSLSLCVITNKC